MFALAVPLWDGDALADSVGLGSVPGARDGLRLVPESRDRVGVGRYRMHDLDCAGACELGVVGAIDSAHRSLANELQDLVLP
jgi:hypothetical protein